ncbi:gamma carbonic anhydrase family protein [Consotaella aegiceratis]|uniref:gamma carbonic anhydrase family protein n=1 Tax=Consotaella aegiceratis TaxID=3097961 RepID=UPI002F428DD3
MPIYALDEEAPDLPDADDIFVAPTAHVIGRVRLERDVGIWFGAALRGDNEWIRIGTGSNVQENCVFHTDIGFPLTVGRGCTVGHGAIVHGCTVGDNTMIGMGAIVLNGAHIGANSIVGAGSLVTEGKCFPGGSLLLGSPARVARPLAEAEIRRLREIAARYVAKARQYKTGLKRLDRE